MVQFSYKAPLHDAVFIKGLHYMVQFFFYKRAPLHDAVFLCQESWRGTHALICLPRLAVFWQNKNPMVLDSIGWGRGASIWWPVDLHIITQAPHHTAIPHSAIVMCIITSTYFVICIITSTYFVIFIITSTYCSYETFIEKRDTRTTKEHIKAMNRSPTKHD